jgi:predicted HTH transcriptional regulator
VTAFANDNPQIDNALKTHFIRFQNFGIESDDYDVFLRERANLIFDALQTRLEPTLIKTQISECQKLITQGESSLVEFKSTLRWDVKRAMLNKKLEFDGAARTISAFMNSNGGNLIIGVDDDRNILGLDSDIQTLGKKNLDGFELQLIQVIRNYIGSEYSSHIKISFEKIENKDVCWIKVSKSSSPIFVKFEGKEHFFNRAGASTQSLSRAEQSAYEREHWG